MGLSLTARSYTSKMNSRPVTPDKREQQARVQARSFSTNEMVGDKFEDSEEETLAEEEEEKDESLEESSPSPSSPDPLIACLVVVDSRL